ncbi:hypothetical protein ACET3Z_005163 [Daucus carota]
MANRVISEMGLPKSISNVFAARNLITAKDVLSLTEFDLMELLDIGLSEVVSAIAHISEITCPPYQTALSLWKQHSQTENHPSFLPTHLNGLDAALCGGIPNGVLTEVVGPAGIGKTQFCLKLSLLASLPKTYGGLCGKVIYIDVESKFSSKRLIEIGFNSFPELFRMKGMAEEMAGRIVVLQPESLSEFTESLQQIKVLLLQQQVKLLIVDSMTALVSGEYEQGHSRQNQLGWHISFIKSLAELSQIPVVLTNQVRSQSFDQISRYSFEGPIQFGNKDPTRSDSHLVAALGINWAHAVTIRLVLEAISGQRYIKVAKSPISPPLAFPFIVSASGILLLSDDGREMTGPQVNTIRHQGHSAIMHSMQEDCHQSD